MYLEKYEGTYENSKLTPKFIGGKQEKLKKSLND